MMTTTFSRVGWALRSIRSQHDLNCPRAPELDSNESKDQARNESNRLRIYDHVSNETKDEAQNETNTVARAVGQKNGTELNLMGKGVTGISLSHDSDRGTLWDRLKGER